MNYMKKSVILAGLLLLLPLAVRAQGTPKGELGVGYSMLRLSDERATLHGWDIPISGNINENLAMVFDFSGHYGNVDEVVNDFGDKVRLDFQTHSFMVGPKVMETVGGRWTPFAQVLVGVARTNFDLAASSAFFGDFTAADTETGLAMTVGGGLDLIASPKVAIRLIQAEYAFLNFPFGGTDLHRQGARVGAGIVFRFGNR
jgi:hypothetical protein